MRVMDSHGCDTDRSGPIMLAIFRPNNEDIVMESKIVATHFSSFFDGKFIIISGSRKLYSLS